MPDTLYSLPKILQEEHWKIEEKKYSKIDSIYLDLEQSENFKYLEERVIDKKDITNLWKYQHYPPNYRLAKMDNTTYIELSRVCFDNQMNWGFFNFQAYRDEGKSTGYGTLILVKKENDKWELVDGKYYR